MKISEIYMVALMSCSAHRHREDAVIREIMRVGLADGYSLEVRRNDASGQANVAETFEEYLKRGYRRVLVLENDVRFLKDAERALRIIESAPSGCNAVYFDIFPHWNDAVLSRVKERRAAGVSFMQTIGGTYGASCWLADEIAMRRFVENHRNNPDQPPDSPIFVIDPALENCFSLNPPCVQVLYADANNLRWGNAQHALYRRWGVDYSQFNVEAGYGYGKTLGVAP